MATLIPFPTEARTQTAQSWSSRLRETLISAVTSPKETLPANIDWSLMRHLAARQNEGDSPRAA